MLDFDKYLKHIPKDPAPEEKDESAEGEYTCYQCGRKIPQGTEILISEDDVFCSLACAKIAYGH